ncbi:MAG: hypothetical protein ACQES9_00580 [Myxococcota bacterium]
MKDSQFKDSILYYKLKELEESSWSGTLLFMDKEKEVKGTVIFSEGLISWASSSNQKETLFTSMKYFANIEKKDILFAETMYKSERKKTNFLEIVEKSGLMPFWMLRECLRIQIYNALADLAVNPVLDIIKNSNKVVHSVEHLFKIDEIEYAAYFNQKKIKDIHSFEQVEFIQASTLGEGTIYRWPEKSGVDSVGQPLVKLHNALQRRMKTSLVQPIINIYVYNYNYYFVTCLHDVFGTIILIKTDLEIKLETMMKYLSNYRSLIMAQLSEDIILFS